MTFSDKWKLGVYIYIPSLEKIKECSSEGRAKAKNKMKTGRSNAEKENDQHIGKSK